MRRGCWIFFTSHQTSHEGSARRQARPSDSAAVEVTYDLDAKQFGDVQRIVHIVLACKARQAVQMRFEAACSSAKGVKVRLLSIATLCAGSCSDRVIRGQA